MVTPDYPVAAPGPERPVTPPTTVQVIRRINTARNVVFITMDDGLVRDPVGLAIIRAAKVPVTLFPIGPEARIGAGYWRQWIAAGAAVEDHTIHHPDMDKLSLAAQTREICDAAAVITSLFGRRPLLFRPPYGNYNSNTVRAAQNCGMRYIVLWHEAVNNGTVQFQGPTRLEPGDIILMHFRKTLAEDLNAALVRAKTDGMAVGRLEDYLGVP
jgi:peptidoglycan/xylan/chitin deacetylase (PgdA/CDA1 family)